MPCWGQWRVSFFEIAVPSRSFWRNRISVDKQRGRTRSARELQRGVTQVWCIATSAGVMTIAAAARSTAPR